MHERMILTSSPLLDQRDASDVEETSDHDPRAAADADDGFDKYDLASLACTD